jgi:hypothetical protein
MMIGDAALVDWAMCELDPRTNALKRPHATAAHHRVRYGLPNPSPTFLDQTWPSRWCSVSTQGCSV